MHSKHITKVCFKINYFLAIAMKLAKYLSSIVFKFSSHSFYTGPHDHYQAVLNTKKGSPIPLHNPSHVIQTWLCSSEYNCKAGTKDGMDKK
jgi:uncharacterized protein YraI